MARHLLRFSQPDMLLLWDRNFLCMTWFNKFKSSSPRCWPA